MPTSADDLYEALWVLADGPGATVRAIQTHPTLMRLRYVVTDAMPGIAIAPTPRQVATICRERIRHAATSIGPPPKELQPGEYDEAGAAAALLGVLPGTLGQLPKDRRQKAAALMNQMKVDTLRKRRPGVDSHEQRLIRQVAEAMHARETAFVVRTGREMTAIKEPLNPALSEHWLLRYEHYYRMWSYIGSLRGNIVAVLHALRTGERDIAAEYAPYALYDYATFNHFLRDFVDRFGGLWIFADADTGETVAASVYLIAQVVSELTHRDDSILRLIARDRELDTFLTTLAADPRGPTILNAWQRWLSSCHCDLDTPSTPTCNVHRLLAACETYLELIDADWYLLADWYREPPKYRRIIDPATLFQQLKLIACDTD